MGYAGKLKEKKTAIKLRKKGFSYNQIKNRLRVSKSTLSIWCRDIILTPKQMENLIKRKLRGSEKGRIIGAKKQQQKRVKKTKKLLRLGMKEVGKLSKRDEFIAGIGLYLGDGFKIDKSVGFSNSNPKIISFMMRWFRNFCDVLEKDFRGRIWIHDSSDEKKAKKYWSKTTMIPIDQFHRSYIVKNKQNSNKIRKKLHSYGVFTVIIMRVQIQRKILGYMSGILRGELI